ncbi:diguanylate cyclase [Methylobacterium terrae]|uniref:Diguanylate cyclase n=1 Tax=Methylobacterium terrae TaxID=2202827 RepID=A0A2U8WNI1_9HYPH|nr:PAS domain-containing protein [Methylobacterium terrae]AWN47699.1 diguanylate cyclase [Methylobacterium terrae]
MIFTTDSSGSLSHISPEWTTLTGQEITAAAEGGWLACVHEADRGTVQEVFTTAAATVSEFSVRFRLCFADGSVRWVGAGGVPSYGPPDRTFIGYLGSVIEIASGASDAAGAYGNIGRYLPPPTHPTTMPGDSLDRIADHLIMAHSLIEEDGGKPALPALRAALFEIGRALARRTPQMSKLN